MGTMLLAAGSAPAKSGSFTPILIVVVIGVAVYFLMMRPQQRRRKQMMQVNNELSPGMRVRTTAGIYGTIVAGGVTAMLMFQVFVNVGMTLGIMPITGIPLPLISYGGSSVLVTLMAIGFLQSIHAQAREIGDRKGRAVFQ